MPGKSFKATLKNAYKSVFKATNGVQVIGVTFDGKPYAVDIPNSVPGKVISDTNLTPEKLAILDILPDIVKNGEYVGSGQYVRHGSKDTQAIRYDYFETDVYINGKPYIAKFDVEVVPGANNYRTHQVIKMDLTPAEASLVGPSPTASSEVSSPVEGTRPLNSDSTISQDAENVNPADPLLKLLLGGGRVDQSKASNEQFAALEDGYLPEGLDALPIETDGGMMEEIIGQEREHERTTAQTDTEESDGLLRSGGQGADYDRRRAESGAEFLGREHAGGRTTRTVGEIGYGYRPVLVERQTAYAREILGELQKLGVESFAYEGELRANINGRTVTDRGEAATLLDGSVGIPNRVSGALTPREIAAHEAYHSVYRRGMPEATAYMDAVQAHIQVDSELAEAYVGAIIDGYFKNGYDHNDLKHRRKLMDELCAYISGDLYERAVDVSDMFDDYGAMKAA